MKERDGNRVDSDGDCRQKSKTKRAERAESIAESLLAPNEEAPQKSEIAATGVGAAESVPPVRTKKSVRKSRVLDFEKNKSAEARADKPDHSGHRKRLRDHISGAADLSALSDEALLEALLSYVTVQKDTAGTANEMLSESGSLWNALNASPKELAAFPSVSERAARAVSDVARLAHEQPTCEIRLPDRARALEFFASLNAGDAAPRTNVVYLSADFRVLGVETFRGVKPVEPVAVLAGAYRRNAKSVIIGRRDSEVLPMWQNGVEYASELGEILDAAEIVLLDIMVFTGLGYYSLGADTVVKDGYVVFTFTPLASVREVGEILCSATVESEEE